MSKQLEQKDKDCIVACKDSAADCGHCFSHTVGNKSVNSGYPRPAARREMAA